MLSLFHVVFFFFKQKTAYEMRISDWSSDVCSSDLTAWLRSADLGPVRFVDRPSDQRLVVEHGDEDDDIRQMCATALIGRVGDEDVPRSDRRRIGVMLEQRDHCRVERGEKGGDAVTLRQEITLQIGRAHV